MLKSEVKVASTVKSGKDSKGDGRGTRAYEAPQVVFVGRARDLLQGSGTAALDFGGYGWMRRY
jgi:hypothetical protein